MEKESMKKLLVKVPSKVILSGEHAVVYNHCALVTAVSCCMYVSFCKKKGEKIKIHLSNLNQSYELSFDEIEAKKNIIFDRYNLFLDNKINIGEVIEAPVDLAVASIGKIFEKVKNISQFGGLEISVKSDISMASGMGSSAALILGILFGCHQFFGLKLTALHLKKMALELENLQHGKSSGIDIQSIVHGGVLFVDGNKKIKIRNNIFKEICLVHTGKPMFSTGEVVNFVKKSNIRKEIWSEFETVTRDMKKTFLDNNEETFLNLVKENNQKLIDIGIIPNRIILFIQEIEKLNLSAKVCGASTIGQQDTCAGIIGVFGHIKGTIKQNLKVLCAEYGFEYIIYQINYEGITMTTDY